MRFNREVIVCLFVCFYEKNNKLVSTLYVYTRDFRAPLRLRFVCIIPALSRYYLLLFPSKCQAAQNCHIAQQST